MRRHQQPWSSVAGLSSRRRLELVVGPWPSEPGKWPIRAETASAQLLNEYTAAELVAAAQYATGCYLRLRSRKEALSMSNPSRIRMLSSGRTLWAISDDPNVVSLRIRVMSSEACRLAANEAARSS